MNKPKILKIQETITRYNIPVFNKISEHYDLTVIYSENIFYNGEKINFKIEHYPIRMIGGFAIYKKNIVKKMKEFDVVICSPYLKYINLVFDSLFYGKQKTIYYGIGVVASYKNHYDSKKWITKIFSYYLKMIGACIFYSYYPVGVYNNYGVDNKKMFVANNTIEVKQWNNDNKKSNNLLFIGTLYKEKGINELLDSYLKAYKIDNNIDDLEIIGNGPELETVKLFVHRNHLSKKIIIRGAIYDENELIKSFMNAIACISPNQAGLSVLKSMGYAVPFITKKNAITGGEIFNIKNGENGVLYSEDDELAKIILDIKANREKYIAMGMNAKNYYDNYCTLDHMVSGFVNAIESVLKEN